VAERKSGRRSPGEFQNISARKRRGPDQALGAMFAHGRLPALSTIRVDCCSPKLHIPRLMAG
jgi:hypothetical protein